MSSTRSAFARLGIEVLEERNLMSASFLGYSSIGNWETVALASGNVVETSSAGHWDPYGMIAVVQGDFAGGGQVDVAGWNGSGFCVVGVPSGNGQFAVSQWLSGGFGASVSWKTFLVGDFTGNGLDDIAMFSSTGQWWLAVSTGSSFQMERWDVPGAWAWGPNQQWDDWQVGDFNGDGKTDVAGLTNRGVWQVGISTGTSFQAETWVPSRGWPIASPIADTFVGDVNGDGKTDLFAYVPTTGELLVGISTGTSFTTQVWAHGLAKGGDWLYFHTGDFNGDGRTDLAGLDRLGNIFVFASTGTSFVASEWSTALPLYGRSIRLTVGDFNDDGMDDIAVVSAGAQVGVAISTGSSFTYVGAANLGAGPWYYTFSTDRPEPDHYIDRHTTLQVHTAGTFLTPTDMAILRTDPNYFATIFQDYQYELAADLGPSFAGIGQDGLAFCLSTIVAYQSASYGNSAPPDLASLNVMLSRPTLVCNEYCYLAAELYRVAVPLASDPNTTLMMAGFGSGPFGNHAQLFFTNGSVSILGDPTLGLVALAQYNALRLGAEVAAKNIKQIIDRVEVTAALQSALVLFRGEVYAALIYGEYPKESFLYLLNETTL